MKTATCYNCGETGHISRTCKKPKKSRKNESSPNEKGDDKTDDKKANGKANKSDKKRSESRAKMTKEKTMRQRARAAKEDLESVSGSSDEDDEAAYLIKETETDETAVNGEPARYAAEEIAATTETKRSVENEAQNETAYRMNTEPRWVIDSGATSHCTDDISIFENIATQTRLPNGSTAKLAGVLMVPGIGTNLLPTQALLAQGIENHQLVDGVNFYRKGDHEIVAKGSHEGKTSYLTWVRDEKALANEAARRTVEPETARRISSKNSRRENAGKKLKISKKIGRRTVKT